MKQFSLVVVVILLGCTGNGNQEATYYGDVSRILTNNCVGCHATTDGIAPFDLESYESAAAVASLIAPAVQERRMPPSLVDNSGTCQTYQNARWLNDADIQTLVAWVEAGAPEGEPREIDTSPPALPALVEVDATLTTPMHTPNPPAGEEDEYRCYVMDAAAPTDQYLTAFDIQPGNPRVVHHIVVFLPTSDTEVAEAEALDAGDAEPGYLCFGAAGVDATVAAVWSPGGGATLFPEGTGILLPANRKLIIQVHYNTVNGAEADTSELRFDLSSAVVEPATFILVGTISGVTIPAGAAAHQYVSSAPVLGSGKTYAVFPHMHLYGTRMELTRTQAGSTEKECVMSVPRWDFHWQSYYFYSEPLPFSIFDSIELTCEYDTTSATSSVSFGEGTGDEMCLVGFYVTL